MKHRQELQRYNVYDITVNRAAKNTTALHIGEPGLLQEVVYTPLKKIIQEESYIYGTNNILLNYNGELIWRKDIGDLHGLTSLTIRFSVISTPSRSLYSVFNFTGIIQLTLFSERILISRADSSWYKWNELMTKCVITHNLDGYIDFITRYNSKEEIFISNTVVDNNTLTLNFDNFFNGDLVTLLKYFKLTTSKTVTLSSLIDFSLYDFSNLTIINIYKDTDTLLPSNIPGILAGSELVMSGKLKDMRKFTFDYKLNQYYKVYAITPLSARKDYILLIVWKLDESKDPLKQNVFSYLKYSSNDCIWKRYDNELGYDLEIPYRFTFLGYSRTHNLPLTVTDSTGLVFLLKAESWADSKTLTNDLCITKEFTFGLLNKQMKVLTPLLNTKDLCQFILIYSSCWAESYFCNLLDKTVGLGLWSTKRNMYNELVQVLTLKHKLKGIVKVHIRDIRSDLYDTYILNDSTIQIIFMKHYKYNKCEFFVDLYTIWKNDN